MGIGATGGVQPRRAGTPLPSLRARSPSPQIRESRDARLVVASHGGRRRRTSGVKVKSVGGRVQKITDAG